MQIGDAMNPVGGSKQIGNRHNCVDVAARRQALARIVTTFRGFGSTISLNRAAQSSTASRFSSR